MAGESIDDLRPGLTDVHAHPAMNAFLWDRDLRRHYWSGAWWNPLASLTDFKMLEKGGVRVLWSSLHIPEPEFLRFLPLRIAARFTAGGRYLLRLNAWECLLMMRSKMERQVASTEDGRFQVAHSNAELDRALAAGATAIVHTVEGGHVLGAGLDPEDRDGRLARLSELADLGVASLTLTHLFPNDLAGHAEAIPSLLKKLGRFDTGVDPDRGLTPTGRAVLERMIELRIVPDVAHCTPLARKEVYELVANRIPVVATHIGMRSLNPEAYNLDEADVKAIAASGGIVGVIFMPHWLDASEPKEGLEAIWRTMEKIRDACDGSWRHVAIGTDFDGFTDPPDDCHSAAQLPEVQAMLERKGLSGEETAAVVGGNARRVLRDGWR
jgi:membrane dipeptidase